MLVLSSDLRTMSFGSSVLHSGIEDCLLDAGMRLKPGLNLFEALSLLLLVLGLLRSFEQFLYFLMILFEKFQ